MATDNFHLVFMPAAADDLDSVFDYIAKTLQAPGAAHKLMNEIDDALNRLIPFPFSAPKCMEDSLRRKGYRKLVVQNFLAFYRVVEAKKEITVMRILYGRRAYEQLV